MCVYVYMYMCIYMRVCVYVYIYVCVYSDICNNKFGGELLLYF